MGLIRYFELDWGAGLMFIEWPVVVAVAYGALMAATMYIANIPQPVADWSGRRSTLDKV